MFRMPTHGNQFNANVKLFYVLKKNKILETLEKRPTHR